VVNELSDTHGRSGGAYAAVMARIDLQGTGSLDVINALSMVRPELARAVGAMDAAVAGSPLAPRVHELVRMRVAQINQCTVCMAWRTPAAIEAGITDELLLAVDRYRDVADFSAAEKTAIEYAERFSTDSANIDDDLLGRLGDHFSPADIVELTLVIGKYVAFGRFMQVLGLDQSCVLEYAEGGVRER
jgi:AhpD family alkylhydroperoxidase